MKPPFRPPRKLGEARPSDFIPDKELFLSEDGMREHAYGRLCAFMLELVRKYLLGEYGPTVHEMMATIHELTDVKRHRDPIGAIKEYARRRDEWFAHVERLRAEHEEAVDWLKRSPTTSIYIDALGVYQQYVVALVRMKLMKKPADDEMGFLSDEELLTLIPEDDRLAYAFGEKGE